MNPNESRLLIPIILRAQRGFTFTFGKFATLSMESFTAVNISYLYFFVFNDFKSIYIILPNFFLYKNNIKDNIDFTIYIRLSNKFVLFLERISFSKK